MKYLSLSIFTLTILGFSFYLDENPIFKDRINLGEIQNSDIKEASGIAASYINKGVLYTHNDSGDENRFFAFDKNGNHIGIYHLEGVVNRDWEDIAVGPGPNENNSYIYIGDIGDNLAQHQVKYIYRVVEPFIALNKRNIDTTLSQVETISFDYPDGNYDAETLMIDPISKSIYIITKRESKVKVYKLNYPQSTTNLIKAELATELFLPFDPQENKPLNYITGGDISIDGKEITIKSYDKVFYWKRDLNITIEETLKNSEPLILPYEREPQGEAICWNPFDDKGYFTLSEEEIFINNIKFNFPAYLYYYPRVITDVKKKTSSFKNYLYPNYPNPFNPTTNFEFELEDKSNVTLNVFDSLGKKVAEVINDELLSGRHLAKWNAGNVANSVYFVKLESQSISTNDYYTSVRKIILLK